MPPFEEIDHTADWAFRVSASSQGELFVEAAQAVYQLGGIQTDPMEGSPRTIRLQADDPEGLFISWLNELLFLVEHERIALRGIRIEKLGDGSLTATGRPSTVTAAGKYIKAATYSDLRIAETDGVWRATVVLDV
jgi:SHS2 domain-containing protein